MDGKLVEAVMEADFASRERIFAFMEGVVEASLHGVNYFQGSKF